MPDNQPPDRPDQPAPYAPKGLSPRLAGFLALASGALAGGAVLVFGTDAPWWMAPFVFIVVGVVVLRLLRPIPRITSWLDEA